ncbi:Cysteine--tRNA ligase [Candidatus Gugararchaeum adminiculabundum]|nr:Cysteine--tRNA ligase [Candidatus Gugararchaeum adminiculabundum]
MKVQNTLTRRLEIVKEQKKDSGKPLLTMYVCGITPYDHTHLGHARTYVAFDVIRRYLEFSGYKIWHVQNVTDVDDKIINRAKEAKQDPLELSKKFDKLSRDQLKRLNVLDAHVYPKVSESISDITSLIQKIEKNGFAYKTSSGIYFDVEKFAPKGYGKLSNQNLELIKKGARVEVDEEKKSAMDFALWKFAKPGEPASVTFNSPWGKGRPGWHIECSAMSMRHICEKFGIPSVDIHGGARDLIFPHHENEIAQSEAASGKPFVRYWLHTGFLTVNGEKMAKSMGNFVTIEDMLKKYDANAIRLFFIQTDYGSPIDFSEKAIAASANAVDSIKIAIASANDAINKKSSNHSSTLAKEVEAIMAKFSEAMQSNFSTSLAYAALFELVHAINKEASQPAPDAKSLSLALEKLNQIVSVFGLQIESTGKISKEIEAAILTFSHELGISAKKADEAMAKIIQARESARKAKDFAKSDLIRKKLSEIGIILEDSASGAKWRAK